MNIRKLAWKNLFRRKARAGVPGLGIFVGIGTFVALSSLTMQMEGAVRDKLDRFGANILVVPRTEQLSLGVGDISLGGAQVAHAKLSVSDGEAIRSIELKDRLRSVVPFFLTATDASGKDVVWMGLPAEEIAVARPWWKVSGMLPIEKGEVLLGSEAAALLDKGPGGAVLSGGRKFRAAGVLIPTGEKEEAMVIVAIGDVQALDVRPGNVTFFEIAALCKDCPVEDIVTQIGKALPGARGSGIRP